MLRKYNIPVSYIVVTLFVLICFNMASMTFGQKSFGVKPPDKGSFPLDHEGECKVFMMKYMRCLHEHKMSNSSCRNESKDYLQCRMDRDLMKKEDFTKLGFTEKGDKNKPS